jgi:hypothetical protein
MKKRMSACQPLAVIMALAAVAYLHAYGDATTRTPLTVQEVTAELARTVSYGYITDGTAKESPSARDKASLDASDTL